MSTTLRRIAAFALSVPFLLSGAAAATADGPGSGSPSSQESSQAEDFVPVTAPEPAFDIEASTFTIPDLPGLQYADQAANPLAPGVHRASTLEIIRAYPAPGHSLTGIHSWNIRFEPANTFNDPVVVASLSPTVDVERRTFTIPDITGLNTALDPWTPVSAGTHALADGVDRLGVSVYDQAGYAHVGVSGVSATFVPLYGYRLREPVFDLAGHTVQIPTDPRVQYTLNGGVISQGGTYTVTGTVTVSFKVVAERTFYTPLKKTWRVTYPEISPFVDVTPGMEHFAAMTWMAREGISTGWPTPRGAEYRPLTSVSRDAMAAFLYRQAGSPAVTLPAKSPFTDVKPGQPHYEAIIWASQEGITEGWKMPDGTHQFRPVQPIARDAMAAFLYRFAGEPAYTQPSGKCFTDVARGMQFSKEMCWMKSTGISTGWSNGTYRPLDPVKRDAMAAFLQRYDATL
ncbi:S-layer homology domain-containing protein [Brachybacterium sp. AOP42-C2-15]|uniref:S-layer homology domain-containing protein n=1 Tax=unclassified Brachybacterium TaxID=2623841 RepID=UPI003F8E6A37